jgi:hypothetical protein
MLVIRSIVFGGESGREKKRKKAQADWGCTLWLMGIIKKTEIWVESQILKSFCTKFTYFTLYFTGLQEKGS